MTSPLEMIQRLYPKARITSGYRGPNHPLSRRNPSSAHMHGTPDNPGAVDVAPIPGVSFADYVSSLKRQGLPISGARDEALHPMPWTTGPNWHVSLLGNAQVAAPKKPRTLADIAKPDTGAMPVGLNAQPMQPMSLADLQLPQGDIPEKKRGVNLGQIAGILGDALMAYGGMQPQFGPMFAREREQEADRTFDREKFNAQLEAQRNKAMEPPQFVQNLQAWMQLPEPLKQQYIQYQDITNPIAISTPQGTQRVPRSMGGPTPGAVEDGYTFLGGDPADPQNWKAN